MTKKTTAGKPPTKINSQPRIHQHGGEIQPYGTVTHALPLDLEEPVRLTSTLLAIRHAYELVADPCPSCPRRDPSVREREMYFVP